MGVSPFPDSGFGRGTPDTPGIYPFLSFIPAKLAPDKARTRSLLLKNSDYGDGKQKKTDLFPIAISPKPLNLVLFKQTVDKTQGNALKNSKWRTLTMADNRQIFKIFSAIFQLSVLI